MKNTDNAEVAELADAHDLPAGRQAQNRMAARLCGFNSHRRHQEVSRYLLNILIEAATAAS